MKERWITARREEGRRRRRVLLALLGVVVVLGAGVGALESPLAAIHRVRVVGNAHETVAQIRGVAGLASGKPLLSVHPGTAEARLETLPWVDKATVSRGWPTTVSVRVVERVPVGLVPAGPASSALVDASGRVLADVPTAAAPPLPAIVGAGRATAPGSWLAGTGAAASAGVPAQAGVSAPAGVSAQAAALLLASELPPSLVGDVRTIAVGPGPSLSVTVAPDGIGLTPAGAKPGLVTVLFGDATQLPAKVLAFQTMVEQVDLAGVANLDVSVPDRPVIPPAPAPAPAPGPVPGLTPAPGAQAPASAPAPYAGREPGRSPAGPATTAGSTP